LLRDIKEDKPLDKGKIIIFEKIGMGWIVDETVLHQIATYSLIEGRLSDPRLDGTLKGKDEYHEV
jgi:hypothetical protein